MSTTWNARGPTVPIDTPMASETGIDEAGRVLPEVSAPGRPRLLSTAEVAEWVGRSERTVRGWARDGLLRKRRVGRGIYYSEADVFAALNVEFGS